MPEARAMVHLGEMGHLMRHHLIDDGLGREDQPPAEREVSASRAASPTASCIADGDARHIAPDSRRDPTCPAGELAARHLYEVIANPAGGMRRIALYTDFP